LDDANFSLDTEGWTLGAGMEIMLSDNRSIKGEYRFTQFDSENVIDYRGFNLDLEPSVHTARVVPQLAAGIAPGCIFFVRQ
jgi:opacity protein-like surface antigen